MNRAKLLEAIALGLHKQAGFDNQSTTTAAFCWTNGTLYLTHQQNRRYEDLLLLSLKNFYDTGGPTPVIGTIAGQRQALQKELEGGGSIRKKPFGEVVKTILKFKVSISDEQEKEDFNHFLGEIRAVKVILDSDIFIQSEHHSGFHGESRIVRYLYIKYLKRIPILEMQHAAQGTIERFETDFRARYAGSLFAGSSQGACTYCANMMGYLGILYESIQGTNKDRKDTWRHPLTTTTESNRFGPPVAKTLLATNAVLAYEVHKGPKVLG